MEPRATVLTSVVIVAAIVGPTIPVDEGSTLVAEGSTSDPVETAGAGSDRVPSPPVRWSANGHEMAARAAGDRLWLTACRESGR